MVGAGRRPNRDGRGTHSGDLTRHGHVFLDGDRDPGQRQVAFARRGVESPRFGECRLASDEAEGVPSWVLGTDSLQVRRDHLLSRPPTGTDRLGYLAGRRADATHGSEP